MFLMLPSGDFADPLARVLALPCDALKVRSGDLLKFTDGMPAATCEIVSHNLVLAATPCSGPLFGDAIKRVAAVSGRDVMLVRSGLFPETLDPVAVDLALPTSGQVLTLEGMAFSRNTDGALSLVPPHCGPVVEIGCHGLRLERSQPATSRDERHDGLCRASAEIVRIMSRRTR